MRRSTLFLVPLALLGLATLAGGGQPGAAADDGAWTPVTIVYEGDVVGKIEPCG